MLELVVVARKIQDIDRAHIPVMLHKAIIVGDHADALAGIHAEQVPALGAGAVLLAQIADEEDIFTFRAGQAQLIRHRRMTFLDGPLIGFQIVAGFLEQLF